MSEIERILDNKPSRPPMISTLALRWQSMCPHGSGGGSVEEAGSPKSEGGNSQDQEQTKEVNNKLPFCEIQWSHMRIVNRLVTPHCYWCPTSGSQGLTRMRLVFASLLYIWSRPDTGRVHIWPRVDTTIFTNYEGTHLRRLIASRRRREHSFLRGIPNFTHDLYLSYVTLVDTRRYVDDKRDVFHRESPSVFVDRIACLHAFKSISGNGYICPISSRKFFSNLPLSGDSIPSGRFLFAIPSVHYS